MKTISVILLVLVFSACKRQEANSFVDQRDEAEYSFIEVSDKQWMTNDLVYLDKDIYSSGAWAWNCKHDNFEQHIDCNPDCNCILYNWSTAGQSCPDGWHLPGKEEWEELAKFYQSDKSGVSAYNGFNLSFDGRVRVFDQFCLIEGNTFWTSDSDQSNNLGVSVAIHRSLDGNIVCEFEESQKDNAFYVRCIRNTKQ